MTVRGATLAGRRAAGLLQTDGCVISRPGEGEGVFDPETGVSTPPAPVAVYGTEAVPGACRVRMPSETDRQLFSGEHEWTLQDRVLSLPVEAVGLKVGDTVRILTSELDLDLPGRVYEVRAVGGGSQITARRLAIREVGA